MVTVGRLLWYKTNWIDITQYSPACQSVLDRHRQSVAEVQRARHVRWWYTEGEIFIHSVTHLTLGKEWQKKHLCMLLFWTQIKTEPSKKPDCRFPDIHQRLGFIVDEPDISQSECLHASQGWRIPAAPTTDTSTTPHTLGCRTAGGAEWYLRENEKDETNGSL